MQPHLYVHAWWCLSKETKCHKMPEDETKKIEAKVEHGLINDAQRLKNGEHSNKALITAKQLATVRIEAL